ncbi:MAG: cell division protein FtsL [Pseudomonadota bacterium]
MRWAFYIVGLCLVVASAAWSYRVTYHTQTALDQVALLRSDIRREREAISVLKAEWAWLNRPARLERLVRDHGASLDLAALAPDQFAEISEIAMPPVDDGMEPVALIDLDEAGPETIFAPPPQPRPVLHAARTSQ